LRILFLEPEAKQGMSNWQGILTQEEGSNLVEFALAALIFCAALFGILYFSLALYTAHFVTGAADDAARYAMVRGSTWSTTCASVSSSNCTATSTNVDNYVLSTVPPAISPANLTISTSWPGTLSGGGSCDTYNGANSPNCQVVVEVSYAFNLPLPLMLHSNMNLSSTSTMSIVR
jgi:Flp pilus assembly protein TadG